MNPEQQPSVLDVLSLRLNAYAYVGNLVDKKEIKRKTKSVYTDFFNPLLDSLSKNQEEVISQLQKLKEFHKRNGVRTSPPFLSARLLASIAERNIIIATTQRLQHGLSLSRYLVAFDANAGIMYSSSYILGAEDKIRESFDDNFSRSSMSLQLEADPLAWAEMFLKTRALFTNFAELIKQDPTGMTLLRDIVQELEKTPPDELPFLKEPFLLGARFTAEKAYPIVYSLAQKLNNG